MRYTPRPSKAWRDAQTGERSPGTLAEAIALQEIEGNPLALDEIAMFEMFEREGWSHDRRRAHILALIGSPSSP